MRMTIFFLMTLFFSNYSIGQKINRDFSFQHNIIAGSKKYGLNELNAFETRKVISVQDVGNNGIQICHVQQCYKGVPISNSVQSCLINNKEVVSLSGEAVDLASVKFYGIPQEIQTVKDYAAKLCDKNAETDSVDCSWVNAVNGVVCFMSKSLSSEPIRMNPIWYPEERQTYRFCIETIWLPNGKDCWFSTIQDAKSGSLISEQALINDVSVIFSKDFVHRNNFTTIDDMLLFDSTAIIQSSQYGIYPMPIESPVVVNAPITVTNMIDSQSRYWHYDGSSYHDSTRGNNIWVQEDRDRNNNTIGRAALSNSLSPFLQFNFQPDFSNSPLYPPNQQLGMTQVFFTINRLHDILMKYGFDESAGNFQNFNERGLGLGNDFVMADAQDAGGINNANFSTPPDGLKPRMQLYLFNRTNPMRDACLDNTVIVHEYMHGVSNRLTGGPSITTCLKNTEQASEGWSDYLALMMTTNWSQMQVNSGNIPRAIGAYVTGSTTGIRTYPYSTDMSINPLTYGKLIITGGNVHKMGEIWCSALWDMTWNIISEEGINSDMEAVMNGGGNVIALQLVILAMKLQPCQPGFLDARDAILRADSILFNGNHSCSIWKAFARRGMGVYAVQGSSNDYLDELEDFHATPLEWREIYWGRVPPTEGDVIEIGHPFVNSNCQSITDYHLTDTLSYNVNWVSGGVYDSSSRTVKMDVNLSANEIDTFSYRIKVKDSTYHNPEFLFIDTVNSFSIPEKWIVRANQSQSWRIKSSNITNQSFNLFCPNSSLVSDERIESLQPIFIPSGKTKLHFMSLIQSEYKWDGGVVEASIDHGQSWIDLGSRIEYGHYFEKLNQSENPLAGRFSFTGNQAVFDSVIIDLSDFSGDSLLIRFRFGSDASQSSVGWSIDDVYMLNTSMIRISSSLYDDSEVFCAKKVQLKNIFKKPPCILPNILLQPAHQTVCNGSAFIFKVIATGDSVFYQWQRSHDGVIFENIPGESDSIFKSVATGDYSQGYFFRCLIWGLCGEILYTNPVSLSVNNLPIIPFVQKRYFRCGQGINIFPIPLAANTSILWDSNISSPTRIISADSSLSYWQSEIVVDSLVYHAKIIDTITKCVSSEEICISHIVCDTPQPAILSNVKRCGSGSVVLVANHSENSWVNWYFSTTDSIPLLERSDTMRTDSLRSSTFYYAETRNEACKSDLRTRVEVSIMPLPPDIRSASASKRCGPGEVQLKAISSSRSRAVWFLDSACRRPLAEATTSGVFQYVVPHLDSTTFFYVVNKRNDNDCISANPRKITALIHPTPSPPVIQSTKRCGPGKVTITGGGVNQSSEYIKWYQSNISLRPLASGMNYRTNYLIHDTVYYAETYNRLTKCASENRVAVPVQINKIPVAPEISPDTICKNTNAMMISLDRNDTNETNWYKDSRLRILLLSNSDTFITPLLVRSVNYYAVNMNTLNGCTSSISVAPVKVTSCSDLFNSHEIASLNNDQFQQSFKNVKSNKDSSSISVFPNPFTGQCKFSITNDYINQPLQIEVFDVTGKLVEKLTASSINDRNIMGLHWSAGTYFIKLQRGNHVQVLRVVKQ